MTDSIKLQVKNLNFYYGAFHALKNINMNIPAGKVTAFIGPSGCGKSTLLRIFNRMFELYPNLRAEGELLLDGKNILGRDIDVNLLRQVEAEREGWPLECAPAPGADGNS